MNDAIHSIWSEPLFSGEKYTIEDFEILMMALSTLTWQKYNGNIKLVADEKVLEYFQSKNLLSLWNGGSELLEVKESFSAKTFWAAGKLYALKQQNSPIAVIDTDFIVWKNIDKLLSGDVVTAHEEEISDVYPAEEYFRMDDMYNFKNLSWNVNPYNTAFLYIKDMIFKEYYISQSINFMRHCLENRNDVISMVFAEQRLLAMCANQWNIDVNVLMDYKKLNNQKTFTHIWGYKYTLRNDTIKRKKFCSRCAKRIKTDFPEMVSILSEISQTAEYFL